MLCRRARNLNSLKTFAETVCASEVVCETDAEINTMMEFAGAAADYFESANAEMEDPPKCPGTQFTKSKIKPDSTATEMPLV
jgi:hypothetical protein